MVSADCRLGISLARAWEVTPSPSRRGVCAHSAVQTRLPGSQPATGMRLPAWLEFCLLMDVGQCLEHPHGKLPEGHFLVLTSC